MPEQEIAVVLRTADVRLMEGSVPGIVHRVDCKHLCVFFEQYIIIYHNSSRLNGLVWLRTT